MNTEELVKKIKEHEGLSRRDALKMMALSPIAASVLAGTAAPATAQAASSNAVGKIVIVGGGSGALMVLARLRRALTNPDITIIAPNEKHVYQPGQIFVAAGEYDPEDIIFDNTGYIGDDVTWIKDEAATFDPDNNKITTKKGTVVGYDYLVVATGVQYHYEQIEGLTADMLGQNGIASVYQSDLAAGTAEGGTITHEWFKALKEAAKTSKPRVICTQPSTPLKCGGAPQKILYLADDFLKRDKLTADFTFATAGEKLFALPEIEAALDKVQKGYGNITNKFGHELIRIDAEKKIATFHHTYQVKGEFDKDLGEYDMIDKEEDVDVAYDFIHISPPTAAVDAVANSMLGWQKGTAKGWLEVDRETLQHRRYKNVFGIGDVCGIPIGKTGGSARHQGPIVVGNLISVMEKKEPALKFDGYTVCPLKVSYGKIIMAEFNYDGLAPSFPLDPAQPRWVWWAFDLYMLQPMYRYLMLNGLM
ncbi:NAD(P)/FAD-dependent oxidoreductase [Sulfuricurvum sp.]|uniref:NAD(P)/FAD-dependent oxidoreductase n=1 Tax=Sulfuricurvum sp. TaxID=2025608 RepID=UPI002E35F115|nr:FAD-dependent oxidoreductase [Sulfuricurvum sp.]HEX5328845.1 FAD-dependent oxidoreductase [Sulfuricurvum sp.]